MLLIECSLAQSYWEAIAIAFSTNGSINFSLSSEINVTPLIEVLLVMLIIFMAIVPIASRGLETSVPFC
jgi:biopolymer transport protein TolR